MSSFLRDHLHTWWNSLDQGQHLALSFLGPCAFLALVLAGVSLHATITMPFRAPKTLLVQTDQTIARQRAEREARTADKDTDGDGITDQDETRTFKTSPYLVDTDSDGVNDGDEVRLGTDPLCPKDKDCYDYTLPTPDETPSRATSTPATGGASPVETPPIEALIAASVRGPTRPYPVVAAEPEQTIPLAHWKAWRAEAVWGPK